MSRLYGRNRLVQTLLLKQQFEEDFEHFDKFQWYSVNSNALPTALRSSFVQMEPDQETDAFLNYCRDVSDSLCLQIFYDIASFFLSWIYTKTCINGMLGRGIMFIFSSTHLSRLLTNICDGGGDHAQNYSNSSCSIPSSSFGDGVMLDLGAGDGHITEKFRAHFKTIYATEASPTMQRRLRDRDVKLLSIDDWWRVDEEQQPHFQLISCLNLLDRHPKPFTLLEQLRRKAKSDDALLLMAVVLPWSQFVEYGSTDTGDSGATNRPTEIITLEGDTFEEQVTNLVGSVLNPAGFEVLRWTRLPYLCEGDINRSVYWLDDVVFLMKAVE